MLPIDKNKVKLKYRIGFTKANPTQLDLLYEIAELCEQENKQDFNDWELRNKTKSRVPDLESNIEFLLNEGYIERTKFTKYKLIKHLWMVQ